MNASKAIGGPSGPPFLFVLDFRQASGHIRPMKTGIILINRCIITC